MRHWIHALTLSAAALGLPAAHADARVDRLFAEWDKPNSPGLAVAVVRNGEILHARGYGQANLEYETPIARDTVFHVASLSKQVTAFAIQLLAEEGKLSLDDQVRKYLPELQVSGITLRHLIHHTSGLRDQWSLLLLAGLRLDDTITDADVLGMLVRQRHLNFRPGDEELYSNSGYTLLAHVVRRVTGKSLAQFSRERIFEPLGMQSTHFQEQYGALVKRRAYSYQRTGSGWRYVALSYSSVGPSSLFTTVEDLAKWERNFAQPVVGGQLVMNAMLMPGVLNNGREISYASGVVLSRYRGVPTVSHGGVDAGYRSHLQRFPAQGLSLILLGNASDLNMAQLVRELADIYLDGQPGVEAARKLPPEVPVDGSELASFVGEYEMRPGFNLSITADRNQLMVQATGQPRFPLFASAQDRFFTKAFDSTLSFFKQPGDDRPAAVWHQGGRDFPLKRVVREPVDTRSMESCQGDFYSDELRTIYTVQVRDGRLMLRYPRGEFELRASGKDAFDAGYPLGSVQFKRTGNACDTLAVTSGRVRNVEFARVRLAGPAQQ